VTLLDTPAVVVDLDRLERNLERWQAHCDRVGLANRPHVKTHRSVEIARRQLALGAAGITCQKLGEAEVMADAGITDILVPYNIVGAENALTGTARATWDLTSPNLGGVSTLQGFADGFSTNRTGTVSFKIAQSDTAGWTADVYRLGWYGGDGARLYANLTPSGGQVTSSQAQPAPADADPDTTLLSADCAGWSTTCTPRSAW